MIPNPRRPIPLAVPVLAACVLGGCANVTGLDAKSSYSCQAPAGVQCQSMSGVYENSIRNNLPSQRPGEPAGGRATEAVPMYPQSAPGGPRYLTTSLGAGAVAPGTPLRTGPKVLRLWIKPWEDSDRDLHGESLIYVQVDNGRWMVEHAQHESRQAYAPVRAGFIQRAAAPAAAQAAGNAAERPSAPAAAAAPAPGEAAMVQAIQAMRAFEAGQADHPSE